MLVLRRPSGALTFHAPDETVRRTRGGAGIARFTVAAPPPAPDSASRGIFTQAIKAIVVKVTDAVIDAAVGATLPVLARSVRDAGLEAKGLEEGWLKVTQAALKARDLPTGKPSSTDRSLLFIHGTFSNAAAAYRIARSSPISSSSVAPLYGDRIFAFDHFTVSRTPEENARMLLEGLPEQAVHLRRHHAFARRAGPAQPRRAGRVSSARWHAASSSAAPCSSRHRTKARRSRRRSAGRTPSAGSPTCSRCFPTTRSPPAPAFVANGLVWLASHVVGRSAWPAFDGRRRRPDSRRCNRRRDRRPIAIRRSSRTTTHGGSSDAAARCRTRSVLRLGERSRRAVRRRMAHRSLGRDVHPRRPHRLFRPAAICPANRSPTSTSSRSPRRRRSSSRRCKASRSNSRRSTRPISLPDRRLLRAGAPGVAAPDVTRRHDHGRRPARTRQAAKAQRAEPEQNPAQFTSPWSTAICRSSRCRCSSVTIARPG